MPDHGEISIRRQCELIGLTRSAFYYQPKAETEENLTLMRRLDELYTQRPFFGARRMAHQLQIGRRRARRLMRKMGLEAIYPKPKTTQFHKEHEIYPYLLRNVAITHCDQVWSIDITYVPMRHGFMYLTAVIDWYSRHVISWRLSNTLDSRFCIEALEESLEQGLPEIFNTDQGSQFTSRKFTSVLKKAEVRISMDGRGRALDNVFVERLWRSVKYEDVYLWDYSSPKELESGLARYFEFYSHERPHQSLDYRTPAEVYGTARNVL